MQKEKSLNDLLGSWNNKDIVQKFSRSKNHKFLDRKRTLKINWSRLHSKVPEILRSEKPMRILDVGCGNGATMEIFRYYGHDVIGMDYSPGFEEGDWLYKSLLKSQNLNCVVHDGGKLPYPFEDKEFDLVICYGAITFFKPVSNWPKVMDEFARLSKRTIVVGVNVGSTYDKGRKYLDNWSHPEFKEEWVVGSIYKWVKK